MDHILVIDDDFTWLDQISGDITRAGYKVITAQSGEQGLERARTGAPDLILLDVNMPRLSGFEILTGLSRDEVTKNIPVIMFSSTTDKNDVMLAMRRGVSDYIIKKPYNPGLYLTKIQAAIKRGRMKKLIERSERTHQIEVQRDPGLTIISFLSTLTDKSLLEDAKKMFNPAFFRNIQHDRCVFDLRVMPEVTEKDLLILERLLEFFKAHETYIVAGRHMGALLAKSDLQEKTEVFISHGDLMLFLKTQKE